MKNKYVILPFSLFKRTPMEEENVRRLHDLINDNCECPECGTRHFMGNCPYCDTPKNAMEIAEKIVEKITK